ncbi:MAG: hypothetical protein KIT83_01140 [Bryobacterales bacterium]|nr:hypothetical protein [Bryobacterales bacterium]
MNAHLTRRSLLRRSVGALFAGGAALTGCRKQALPFPGFALVVTAESSAVSLVDLAAFTLAGKLEFPDPVTQLLHHPESGNVYALSADAGRIHEFHWPTRKLARSLKLGRAVREMILDPNQPALWVSLADPPSLVAVALDGFNTRMRIELPASPFSFDASPYRPHMAASLEGGGLAIVADLETGKVERVRPTESFGLVRFRSDGRQVITANLTDRSLSIVRAEDCEPVVDLPVAMEARNFCFKPDGGQLFVTDGERDGVTIVYPYSTEVDRAVLAGKSPGAMYACTGLPYLLVANRLSSDVTILDMTTGRLVAIVPVGNLPNFVTVTPDQQYALALNQGSGDMAVIRLTNVRSRRNKTAPLFTMVAVGDTPQSMIVLPQ